MMEKGELITMAATARANRDWSQLQAILEHLIAAEPDASEAIGWMRERAMVEETELGDLERAILSWKALAARLPNDVEARDAVTRLSATRGE